MEYSSAMKITVNSNSKNNTVTREWNYNSQKVIILSKYNKKLTALRNKPTTNTLSLFLKGKYHNVN